jgi:hypothetical protein
MALASMFVGVLPLAMAIVYAIWPSEQRLALIRTLSLATIFASINGTTLGFINELLYVDRKMAQPAFTGVVAVGLAESFGPLFFGFGCLTVTWLCVTLGMWRVERTPTSVRS